jgi:hypothetical protein
MNWDILKRILVSLWQTSFGQNGNNNFVTDTTTTTGNWTALQVLSSTARIDTIIIDGATVVSPSPIVSIDINQGVIIYGKITSIKLTNGSVRMYGGSNANL